MTNESKPLDEDAREQFPGEYITLSDGFTRYQIDGPEEAPLVVFIHGFSTSMFIWDHNAPYFSQAGYRTLRYDLYGRGGSERLSTPNTLTLFTRQLRELIAATASKSPWIHLVGICMGSLIATDYALSRPARSKEPPLKSITFISPAGLAGSLSLSSEWLKTPVLGDFMMAFHGEQRLLDTSKKHLYNPRLIQGYQDQYALQMQYAGFKQALLSTIRNVPLSNMLDDYQVLGAQKIHLSVVWGQEDLIVPPSLAPQLQHLLPNVNFYFIPEAGHLCNYEQSKQVNSIIHSEIGASEK
jgi:pimeloyl-ACP methyl ester carboxylesterase